MRLTLHTDYALRVMVHVGLKGGELVTINEIAEVYGISKNHLTKVVHQLGRAGYLETVRGKYGGVRMQADPATIGLGAFIRATEEDFALVRCLSCETSCTCRIEANCLARTALGEALDGFFAVLNRYTLADLIANERNAQAA